jgi:transmembrane sensor
MNTQIYDEASEWLVEFRTGDVDPATRRRFNSWLRISPEHVRAYLELAAIWNEGSRLDPSHTFDATKLIDEPDSNLVPLKVPGGGGAGVSGLSRGDGRTLEAGGRRPHHFRFAAAAAAAMLSILIGAYFYIQQRGLYSTDIGEQRSITLVDGSRIELNSRSQLRVHFTNHARDIELLEGQALFQVANDKTRPFIVHSANTQVRAVGTQFDVYRRESGTTVTVVEGTVSVDPSERVTAAKAGDGPGANAEAQSSALMLTAGQQVTVSAFTPAKAGFQAKPDIQPPIAKPANIATATAWTQNRLVFESATLIEVADEFNRYNERRLVIENPELHDFHITGTFSSSDPAPLLRFLKARPDIIVVEDKDEIRISR